MKPILLTIAFLISLGTTNAQDTSVSSPIIFIYDASGSMWGKMDSRTKMEIAAEVLSAATEKFGEHQKVGLVAYGHRQKGDCEDVEFLVNFDNTIKSSISTAIHKIKPLGKTPLAFSAKLVIDRLRKTSTKATIILVTDGIESCDGNICEVVASAKKEGIDFRMHIIGFGLKEGETAQLACAAKAGDGQYFDAQDAEGLGEVLEQATNTSVDDPAGNYSVFALKNGEAVDAWVRAYKAGSKEEADVVRTYRDSGFLYLPPGKYDLEVKPLEGTDVSERLITIEVKKGNPYHRTVSFDAAKLEVNTQNNGEGWDAVVQVLNAGTTKVVATSRTYGRQQELEINPGVYDVKFKALNMKGLEIEYLIKDITVQGGETKPVAHNFATGIALIGVSTGGELVDATVNFKELVTGEYVTGSRTYTGEKTNPKAFILNPGKYIVTIQTVGKHKGKKETFEIEVKQGETVEKMFTF